ncbi:MAG TPA: BON domain-containing protein [Terracidiphilus sp.]|nr:BON domain-containing protein [Terracidiphilus sp.]
MNRSLLKRSFLQVLVWSGVVVLGAAVALAQDAPAAGSQRSDGQIEMDVVHALDASQALKNDLITAATIQSEVTLSGTVSTDESKKLAEQISSQVPGVTKVHNNLKVGNPQDAQEALPPQPADESDPGLPQQANNQPNYGQPDNGPMPQPQPYPQQAPQQGQYPDQGQYPPQQEQYPNQGQYPQQGQYPPYPSGRPHYGYPQQQGYNQPPQPAYEPAYEPAHGPVTVPEGTLLQLRTSEGVGSKRARDGEPVQFTLITDVTYGGVLAIPRGAIVHGVVTEVKKVGSGDLGGSSALALTLTSLDLGGQSYQLNTDEFRVKGPNKAGQSVSNAVGAGLVGTIIGCAVGGGTGCAVGAGAGVAAGTAASAASSGPGVWIPAEALVTFHLKAPLTVNPVSPQEASRLAQGLYQGGPSLYRRGYPPPYGPRYAGYGYPYGYYPRVYYRPYYMTGGFYYWR